MNTIGADVRDVHRNLTPHSTQTSNSTRNTHIHNTYLLVDVVVVEEDDVSSFLPFEPGDRAGEGDSEHRCGCVIVVVVVVCCCSCWCGGLPCRLRWA